MKVMLVNGSPHKNGTTNAALGVIAEQLGKDGVESEIFWPGAKPISGCIGCMACAKLGRCVIEGDRVNEFVELAESADGFVFGTPTHYAADAGHITSFMHRVFYSDFIGRSGSAVRLKPAAAVAVARRAGAVPAFDQLNRMFTICEMPVVSSRYWNIAFGHNAEELMQDAEGLWTLRTLARNMAFFLKCLDAGKKLGVTPPAQEEPVFTNFIR